MIADFLRAFANGYVAPRASAQQILSARGNFIDAAQLVVLGYALTMICLMLAPGVDLDNDTDPVGRHVLGLISVFVGFFIYSGLVSFFGRVSGGTGTREDSQMIVAWHAVVTAPLNVPVQMVADGFTFEERENLPPLIHSPDTMTLMIGVVAVLVSFWLLANYITVAHRFRNFWGVVAVVIGVPAGLGLFMFNAVGALSTLSQQGIGQ